MKLSFGSGSLIYCYYFCSFNSLYCESCTIKCVFYRPLCVSFLFKTQLLFMCHHCTDTERVEVEVLTERTDFPLDILKIRVFYKMNGTIEIFFLNRRNITYNYYTIKKQVANEIYRNKEQCEVNDNLFTVCEYFLT